MNRNRRQIPIIFAATLPLWVGSQDAFASRYFGRFTAGTYIASESFSDPLDGADSNSFATVSSRAYLRVYELSKKKLEWVTDLRDQHDFFDKLDSERLQLNSRNTIQVRQLSLRNADESDRYFGQIGRYAIPEAGAVNVDGARGGYRFSRSLSTSLFGGLNPRRPDQEYMRFNRDSHVYGVETSYHPKSESWTRSFLLSGAAVTQKVSGHTDRTYLFGNIVNQWAARSQVAALLYLDFVPRTYVQTGLLTYQNQWSTTLSTTVRATTIQALEYIRRRSVLEQLGPSGYREASFSLLQKTTAITSWNYSLLYGSRTADHLSKIEASFGPTFSRFISRHLNFTTLLTHRKDFTNHITSSRSSLGYFSKDWEADLDLEIGLRTQTDKTRTTPIIVELALSRYFSKALFASMALQEAKNDRVNIFSAFAKIGYRFGSEDVAPLRDGAPPPGGRL